MATLNMLKRPRRNRKSAAVRGLVQEFSLQASDLVVPLFLLENENAKESIHSMPGIYRHGLSDALREIDSLMELGIRAVDLFAIVPEDRKDPLGTEALRSNNLIQTATSAIKSRFPELCVMVDVALDPYTDHGHDGILNQEGYLVNDQTVAQLVKMSIGVASAGADVIAPSDMMDGRVRAIREGLDAANMENVSILSYAAKYASAFYGPFRDAMHSAPKKGDKKSYQLNPANRREAILEAKLDVEEGADMLLVKPGLPYLDILASLKGSVDVPVGAYHVSGEYAMVCAAAERGWLDAESCFVESLLSMKRAGADFILTYAAKHVFGY